MWTGFQTDTPVFIPVCFPLNCHRSRFSSPRKCSTSLRQTPACILGAGDTPTIQGLLSTSEEAFSRLQQSSNDFVIAAFNSAMEALGVGEGTENTLHVPSEPLLDPVQAQVLAGYAFRAYDEPSPGCYREVRTTTVPGSKKSGRESQVLVTHFAFPHVDAIAATAVGLFSIMLEAIEVSKQSVIENEENIPPLGANDKNANGLNKRSEELVKERKQGTEEISLSDFYVVAKVNNAVQLDVLSMKQFTILRKKLLDSPTGEEDVLTIDVYENATAYNEGKTPLLSGQVGLGDIVGAAAKSKRPFDAGPFAVELTSLSKSEAEKYFFGVTLLPEDIRLPFGMERFTSSIFRPSFLDKASIQATVSYIPFDMVAPENYTPDEDLQRYGYFAGEDFQDSREKKSAVEVALEQNLEEGQLPHASNWTNLAQGVREFVAAVEHKFNIEIRSTVREDIEKSLFVESLSTGTEAWFFHNASTKDLVIAFRGTEQVSWQDFYTDAQLFLQKWKPGAEIDLNISAESTVGLSKLLNIQNEPETVSLGEDESCVHYGFLRAYHSVRDAVFHAIQILVDDDPEYEYHFVGHSLGGALATLAAADFVAKNPKLSQRVCCMSYGSPKTGNVGFARMFNDLVPNTFRIVNDSDLVVRMPKSIGNRYTERYKHVGRAVLVNEQGEFWAEGEDPESPPMIKDPFRERFTNMKELIAHEKEMWDQLVRGQSVRHHMEDSYFLAMTQVLRKLST